MGGGGYGTQGCRIVVADSPDPRKVISLLLLVGYVITYILKKDIIQSYSSAIA